MIFTILRQEYLQIVEQACQTSQSTLSAAYRYCAAKLIHLFEWQTKQGTERVQITRKQIYEYLLGEHGKDAIAASINFLFEVLNVLKFEQNDREENKRNGQNKTYSYYFNAQKVSELLSTLQNEGSISKVDSSTCKSDCSPTSNSLPSLFSNISSTTNTAAVAEKEVKKDEPTKQPKVVGAVRDTPVRCRVAGRVLRPLKITKITKPSTTPQANTTAKRRIKPAGHPQATASSRTPTPTAEDLTQIEVQLRGLPLTGGFKLNKTIKKEIKKNFNRTQTAIAKLKEAIRTWKVRPDYNWQGQFVAFLRSSESDQKEPTKKATVYPEPNLDQLERLKKLGHKLEFIPTDDGAGGLVQVLYLIRPMQSPIPWWQANG